jgi:hypothetical protein
VARRDAVKYLLMIYGNREKWESLPPEDWADAVARQEAFNARYRETGELLGSYGLADAALAKLVRRVDGLPAVTDGPYLETKEWIGGFWVFELPDLDAALKWATEASKACGGKVEVRPFEDMPA